MAARARRDDAAAAAVAFDQQQGSGPTQSVEFFKTLVTLPTDGSPPITTTITNPAATPPAPSAAAANGSLAGAATLIVGASARNAEFAHPGAHTFSFTYTGTGSKGIGIGNVTTTSTPTTFEVDLVLNTALFSPDYKETTSTHDGQVVAVPPHRASNAPQLHCHYVGSVRGDPTSSVTASTCTTPGGGLSGRIQAHGLDLLIAPTVHHESGGAVHGGGEEEEEEEEVRMDSVDHTVTPYAQVVADSGVEGAHFCGVADGADDGHSHSQTHTHNAGAHHQRARRTGKAKKFVEVLVVNDATRSASFATTAAMGVSGSSIMNQVTAYYKDQAWPGGTEIQVVLVVSAFAGVHGSVH
jgi:hypothetical protein